MKLSQIADEIYRDLDEPEKLSIPNISFWLSANIGKLNNLLNISISVDGETLNPDLTTQEKSIFKLIYIIRYYEKQVTNNLGASQYDWSEVREGDSTIRRVSKNEIAKTFLAQKRDAQVILDDLVFYYKQNKSTPSSFSATPFNNSICNE